jgi:hypothetical protein
MDDVYTRVVNDLIELSKECGNPNILISSGVVIKRLSKDRLEEILIATMESLKMGLKHIEGKASRILPLDVWQEMALEKASLKALLRHGKNCVLEKSKGLGTGKTIALGRLYFCDFDEFSILQGNKELFFTLKNKDIKLGKFRIKSGDTEEEDYEKIEALSYQLGYM